VVVTLLALHDAMDSARRAVLAVVLRAMSQLPLLALTGALVDVVAGVACTFVLVEVGAEVAVPHVVHLRLVGVVLVDLLLDGGEFAMRRSIRSTMRMLTR
jgi:hypothetical protein